MTASPIVAPMPGATPVPETDEAPPQGTAPADGAAQPPARRRRKLALLFMLMGLLAGLVLLALWYLLYREPIPLPGIPETQVPSFSFSVYGTERPLGIAVASDGSRIYVTETDGDKITRIFDGNGNALGTMRPPAATGTDHTPVYVAIDPISSNVYVTDRPTGSIYIYDRDGNWLSKFEPPAQLAGWQPLGLTFDAQGQLYVTNLAGEQNVLVFDREGGLVRSFGQDHGLTFPNGIVLDAAGNAYVTDSNNGRLLVFAPSGELTAQIGRGVGEGNLGLPRGIAIDKDGRVFVVDSSGQGLFVYGVVKDGEARPAYLGFFGGQGMENGQFRFPNAVAVDGRGHVYVTDSSNDRIQVWSY